MLHVDCTPADVERAVGRLACCRHPRVSLLHPLVWYRRLELQYGVVFSAIVSGLRSFIAMYNSEERRKYGEGRGGGGREINKREREEEKRGDGDKERKRERGET